MCELACNHYGRAKFVHDHLIVGINYNTEHINLSEPEVTFYLRETALINLNYISIK